MDQVLLLEDEIALRGTLSRHLLRHQAVRVVEAGGLREAIDVLDTTLPSLVVSSLSLHDGSGLDLLPELAARGLKIPVIFITGDVGRAGIELPESSNIDVVQKPVDATAFSELVRRRLERGKTLPPPSSVFTVADYLQLAALTRRSVSLTISDPSGVWGRIVIHEGNVTWASDEFGEGVEAFARLALLESADIQCQGCSLGGGASNLQGSLDQLLLDAVRIQDERAQHKGSAQVPANGTKLPLNDRGPGPALPPLRGQRPPISMHRKSELFRNAERPPPRARAHEPVPAPERPAPARPEPTQQHKENTVKTAKTVKDGVPVGDLLQLAPTLRAAARSERDGSVLDFKGDMDAETGCAVVALASRQLDEAAAELGLGEPRSWCISMGSATWYVLSDEAGFVVVLGGANKNPMAVLKKITVAQGELA